MTEKKTEKFISFGKAEVLTFTWDTSTGKVPKNGSLLINGHGDYFKVLSVHGKTVKMLKI